LPSPTPARRFARNVMRPGNRAPFQIRG